MALRCERFAAACDVKGDAYMHDREFYEAVLVILATVKSQIAVLEGVMRGRLAAAPDEPTPDVPSP